MADWVPVHARILALQLLDAFKREGHCPVCGTIAPPCSCITTARRIVELTADDRG